MSPSKPAKRGPDPTEAQWRVIDAALGLFAKNGVGGTSLRMIAAELGVTVAAVYHQYNTKDEIISAALDSELRRLEAVVDAAEAEPTAGAAREALVTGMVDLSVDTIGRRVSAVLNDPIVTESVHRLTRFRDLTPRMRHLLMGEATSRASRVRTASLIAAINGAATHPFVADLDDDTLRGELLQIARGLLPPLPDADAAPRGLPTGSPSPSL